MGRGNPDLKNSRRGKPNKNIWGFETKMGILYREKGEGERYQRLGDQKYSYWISEKSLILNKNVITINSVKFHQNISVFTAIYILHLACL